MWEKTQNDLPNCDMIDKYGFYVPNHQDLTEGDIRNITRILNFEYQT